MCFSQYICVHVMITPTARGVWLSYLILRGRGLGLANIVLSVLGGYFLFRFQLLPTAKAGLLYSYLLPAGGVCLFS